MLHLVNLVGDGLACHELAEGFLGGLHHVFKLVLLAEGEGKAGKRDEQVACTALEPGIPGQYVVLVALPVVELVGGVLQAVVEAVARGAVFGFRLEDLLQAARCYLGDAGREHDAFALLDVHLEVAGHVEVFVEVVAALLLLGVLDAAIPVGHEVEFVFLVELHVQFGIAGIHARLDAVLHLLVVAAGLRVLVGVLADAAEGQEGAQAQRGGRVGIDQRVADEDAVFMVNENLLFAEDDASHAVSGCRDVLAVKLTDVLVAVGAEVPAAILVQAQVELGPVLDDRLVQR